VPHELANYKEVIAVALVACIAYFLKQSPALGDDLSVKQNWTVMMGYLARYVIRYLAITIDIDSVLPYADTIAAVLSITVYLTGLALFFSYVRQPLKTVGLSSESRSSLSVPGVRWALVAIFMSSLLFGLSSVRDSSVAENLERLYTHLYFKSDGSLRPIGFLLIEQVCWVFLVVIEEIHYRGLLYGALRKRMAPLPVRCLTATAFMISHDWIDPTPFIMGWLTAALREKYQSLIPGIVLHLGWNTAMGIGGLTILGIGVDPVTYYFSAAVLAAIAYVVVSNASSAKPKSS
jgi:membrane protease YdiL (CAAX protease family)